MNGDTVVSILVACSIPLLARRCLRGNAATSRLHWAAIVLGYAWFAFAFYHVEVATRFFGLGTQDATFHERCGFEIADAIRDREFHVFLETARAGNRAYHVYLGVLFFLTGCTGLGAVMLNMMFTYWAGLRLASSMASVFPQYHVPAISTLFGIFVPSVVYWATNNMKEGLMYWACVQILCSVVPSKERSTPSFVAGILVAAALRPPVAALWIGAVLVVNLFRSGRVGAAMVSLALSPLLLAAIGSNLGAEVSLSNAQQALDDSYVEISTMNRGSVITYYGGKPTFFISGVISLFFRPFFWEAKGAAQMMASGETWLLTLLIFVRWIRLAPHQRRHVFRTPLIQASVIATAMFCVLFTWIGNEGLLHRQKTQALPALLALITLPACGRARSAARPGGLPANGRRVQPTRRPRLQAVRTPRGDLPIKPSIPTKSSEPQPSRRGRSRLSA